jgi:CcmD family protein
VKTTLSAAARATLAPLLAALSALVLSLLPLAARAQEQTQEFVAVEGQVRERIPAAPFIAAAYGFIWAAVLVYVIFVARGLSRVRGEIEELRRKVDAGSR